MKRARPNYFLTVFSISVVLLLLGIYSLIYWHPEIISDRLKEELQIVVELNNKLSPSDQERIQEEIGEMEPVRSATLELISAEQAEREMMYELGPIAEEMGDKGPFRDMLSFSVYAQHYEVVTLAMLATQLKKITGVADVYYQEEVAQQLDVSIQKWSRWALYFGIGLAIIAVLLIYNTIKLALFAEKKTILTLDMVGARKFFIKKPFLKRSILHGCISACIALGIIGFTLYLLGRKFEAIHNLFFEESFLVWVLGMLAAGILMHLLSTDLIIRRFLAGRIQE